MTLKRWQWQAIGLLLWFMLMLTIGAVWNAQLAEQAAMAV